MCLADFECHATATGSAWFRGLAGHWHRNAPSPPRFKNEHDDYNDYPAEGAGGIALCSEAFDGAAATIMCSWG